MQDTWAGATPFGSAPEQSTAAGNRNPQAGPDGNVILTGASSYSQASTLLDKQGNAYFAHVDQAGHTSFLPDRTIHVMSYASPETRKQGDFKLAYEWDEAELNVGGSISTERDYESRFVNLGGRMDFNQKQTTLNLGLSYTNSAIAAILNTTALRSTNAAAYQNQITQSPVDGSLTLHGLRQAWTTHLGLTQVINKDALMELGMGYTRSTGFQENPYKLAWIFGVNSNAPPDSNGLVRADGYDFLEQRPDVRNQWNWSARWAQYVAPFDAAVHLDYQFAHDDWGINAHTFAADWVQPLSSGWTVTPRVRYYSQDAANFYQPYFVVGLLGNPRQLLTKVSSNAALPSNFPVINANPAMVR
jgi:hypothetical protein